MNRDKLKYLMLLQLTILIYFMITITIYYLSINEGNQGVSLDLFGGSDDGYFYWEQAKIISEGKSGLRVSIYPVLLGKLINLTGVKDVLIVRLFNYLGFLLLLVYSMKIISVQYTGPNQLKNKKNINRSKRLLLILFLGYLSLQMNLNLSVYRDIWIYTFYTVSVYLSFNLITNKNNRAVNLFLLLGSIYILGEFRKYAMLSFVLTIIIYLLHKKIIKKPKQFLVYLILFFVFYYLFFIDITILGMSLQEALVYRENAIDFYSGGSQMWIKLDQSNPILFIINYIHSYIGNLLGPLPWQVNGISMFLVFVVETLPMISVLVFLWKERQKLDEIQKYILLHAFVWIGIIGFTNDNIGTATRLRPISWILILIVFVVIYSKDRIIKES